MNKIYPEFFRRVDERPDELFYTEPRFVTHIDEGASRAAQLLYDELLPTGGHILDLMSSYHSHLPSKFDMVTGLGLNKAEMEANSAISKVVVFDLNLCARLPFHDAEFDGVVCSLSVQYMTRPDDTFGEVVRSLKTGAPFIVTFSNRMFPSKAVLAWRASDDAAHMRLVKSYFTQTQGFAEVFSRCIVPTEGDPLYAVWAFKQGDPNHND